MTNAEDIVDPFGATEVDEDPFATEDDVKGGGAFKPRPLLEDLWGMAVVMIPRAYDEKAKNPFYDSRQEGSSETREMYTVDLVVLTQDSITFQYNDKQTVDGKTTSTEKEWTEAGPFPTFEGMWIPQYSLIGQLKKVHGGPRPLLRGVLRRGPQSDDRKNGLTADDIENAFDAWAKKGKRGAAPKFSWFVDLKALTPLDIAEGAKWWASVKATITL